MGNAASVEEIGGGRRTTYKLSKPRVGNLETNILPSPIGLSDPRRRFSTARTTSLPYGTSPVPSPMWPSVDPTTQDLAQVEEVQTERRSRSRSITRAATSLFRSRSSQISQSTRETQNSIGFQTNSQSARPSRANSMVVGPSESSYVLESQPISRPPARTRTSVTYDLNSYEAKRLLNLVEEPSSYEKGSILSEGHFQVQEPRRRDSIVSPTVNRTPAVVISRSTSDVSMYTPIRRRSLLTVPGVATRTPDMSPFSRKPKARFSLPSTPARRDSIENLGLQIPSIPPASLDPYTLVRASTPSDEDYGHIGAFKLGSLRIMNGSPAVSPAVDSPLPLPTNQAAYFAGLKAAKDYFQEQAHTIKVASVDAIAQPDGHQTKQNPKYLSPLVTSPRALRRQGMMMPSAAIPPQIMPAIHVSPLAIQDLVEDSLGLQTTSKHTAVEDDLFEEEHTEYSPNEYLDVRVDLNAKSLPPRPRLISEGRGPRGVMRSDSGLTATPVSEHSQGLLAKSDSGYSSNVSLRSFSAKPPLLEACETSAEVYDVPLQTPAKDAFVTDVRRPTVTTGLVEPYESQQDGSIPPPQPEKSLAACEAVPREYPPVPEKDAKSQASSSSVTSDKSPLSPMSSNTSGSWASIGTGSRKLGKLERLLRSAPKPTSTFQVTSPSQIAHDSKRSEDQGDSVSLWPGPLASRPEPSKANLKATVRVGGVEFQEDVPPVPSLPKIVAIAAGNPRQDLATDPDISFQPTELVTPIRTPSTRKPIARKPLPIRKDSLEVTQLCKKSSQSHRHLQSEVVQPTSASFSEEYCHQSLVAAVMSHELMATSNKSVTQAIQDVTPAELQYFRPAYIDGTENSTLFAPDAAEQMRKSRSPPPVSMRTRKTGSVRATPPARPQSTPPVDNRDLGVSNLPRRPSRERIYSYPLGQPMLSKRSSREDVHSYPPARAVYENLDQHVTSQHFAAMDRRRSVSTKTEDVEHLTPTRDVQTDHGQTYRGTSIANSRRNSLVAQSSQNNSRHPQPVACAQQQEATRLKALRRQSSYDGYSYQHARAVTDSSYEQHMSQGNGPYPFIANASGDTQISDPWSGLPPQQSPNIQSRYPPNIPRGHTRNQSSGSHSDAAPFRVLHSYDSPAYRNAPIWG